MLKEHVRQHAETSLHDKNWFANDVGLRTIFFLHFFSAYSALLSPGIGTPGGIARYQSPPTRATTIRNQLLYIVFYSVYIGVKIRLSSPATEWATLPQGECSRITTVTLPRTSRLRHLNHLRPHLFFFVSSVMFTGFSPTHPTTPPSLSLSLVLIPSFLSLKPSSTSNSSKPQCINTLLQLLLQCVPPCARGIYKPLFS